MFGSRVHRHQTLTHQVEPREDLSCRLFLQLGGHVPVAPQGAEVGQIATCLLQRHAVGIAGDGERPVNGTPGARECIEADSARSEIFLQRSAPLVASSAILGRLGRGRYAHQRQHRLDVGVAQADRIQQCRHLLLDRVGAMGQAVGTCRASDVADPPDAIAGVAAIVTVALRAAQQSHQRIAAPREAAAARNVPRAPLGTQVLDASEERRVNRGREGSSALLWS